MDDLRVFAKFPTLTTERLILRELREEDWPAGFRMFSNPEVMRYMSIYRPALRPASPAAEGFEEFVSEWVVAQHGKARRRAKP